MVSFATEQDTKKKLATELHGITQEEEKTCQENYTEPTRSFLLPFFRVITWLNLIFASSSSLGFYFTLRWFFFHLERFA
jgi:hypothetical protein